MSADVHLLLDLQDHTWLQLFSCWLLQYCDSHLSSNLSHPIWVCSSRNGVEAVLGSGSVSFDHASRFDSKVSRTSGSVPCARSHCLSLFKLVVHCCLALWAGHRMMCCLSSTCSLHRGHCAVDHCPLLSMFLPCANCPVICFNTHLRLYAGASCIALSIAQRSSSSSPGDKFGIFPFQYARAGGPLSALRMSCFGFLTLLFPDISKCQGSYGIRNPNGPWCCGVMRSFASRSASMLSQAALDNTVGWLVSWCPLMCWYCMSHVMILTRL